MGGPDAPQLFSGRLESVRNLLSDALYQRLSASPPPKQVPSGLVLVTKRQSGDDPNRVVVRLSRGVTLTGAEAEDWTLLSVPPAATTAGMSTPPPTPGWIVEDMCAAGPMEP